MYSLLRVSLYENLKMKLTGPSPKNFSGISGEAFRRTFQEFLGVKFRRNSQDFLETNSLIKFPVKSVNIVTKF